MKLTDEQQVIINKAIELIKPYDKENCSFSLHYFRYKNRDGEEIGEETCDNNNCAKEAAKKLRRAYGNFSVYTVYDRYNNSDHYSINSCCICGRPLNEQLTCINYELEHHKQYSVAKKDLTESRTAFNVRCMLEAMPTVDYSISQYCIHQKELGNDTPLKEELKRQSDFIEQVVSYAELVVKVLTAS